MTRLISVEYGGDSFHIVGRELSQVAGEIESARNAGAGWVGVRADGGKWDALLLISPRVPIELQALPHF